MTIPHHDEVAAWPCACVYVCVYVCVCVCVSQQKTRDQPQKARDELYERHGQQHIDLTPGSVLELVMVSLMSESCARRRMSENICAPAIPFT